MNNTIYKSITFDGWRASVQRDDRSHYYHPTQSSKTRLLQLSNRTGKGRVTRLAFEGNDLVCKIIQVNL